MIRRPQHLGGLGWIHILSSVPIPCKGRLISWDLWSNFHHLGGNLRAAVFRPDPNGNPNKFTIVGINEIHLSSDKTNQLTNYGVPDNEVIIVEIGDVIGFMTNENAVIPPLQINLENNVGSNERRYVKFGETSTLIAGDIITTVGSVVAATSFAAHVSLGKQNLFIY